MERNLKFASFDNDGHVIIKLQEVSHIANETPEAIGDEEESGDETNTDGFGLDSYRKPHKDFIDCFKKLRRLALAACDIGVEPKEVTDSWNVFAVKIDGNIETKQSRVLITLQKFVKRTGKYIRFKTPQITMYPEKDDVQAFKDADKITVIVEDLIEECWAYSDGTKTGEEKKKAAVQMALFPKNRPLMKVA
jgi:hypothetical protein